ncbi:MAG: succinate dehydrogenase, cytochrome b556 subunit [Pseudomonadota bacterium]
MADNRPLSPHLFIYKPIPTMVMSILHRITGAALYVGTLLVVWYLMALASGPEAYATAAWFFGSPLGLLILFGYTWALMHHMLGGMRHFAWDFGYLMDKETSTKMAWATLAGSITLTIIIWIIGIIAW